MSGTIVVELKDLKTLADLICDRDTGKVPPTIENIGAFHDDEVEFIRISKNACGREYIDPKLGEQE